MASTEARKRYAVMENVLNYIHDKFIAMPEQEIKRNNVILEVVTGHVIQKMKHKDALFKSLYNCNFYGGSFYDKLKVGNPNEYDLDLILILPALMNPSVECTKQGGFVSVKLDYFKILQRPEEERNKYGKVDTLLDSSTYLSTQKVLQWFEGLYQKAINDFPKEGNKIYIDAALNRLKPQEIIRIYIKMKKGGPAFTLNIWAECPDGPDIKIDIDLVPCFRFTGCQWPSVSGGYRQNPDKVKNTFFVVPKKPREEDIEKLSLSKELLQRYWRLSFQEQERGLISDKKFLKPSLKLIKKLRDKYEHKKISSYFIKTVFLSAAEEETANFWSQSLGVVFMQMLKKYQKCICERKILYYWNKNFNLIGNLDQTTTDGIANKLKKIIFEVEKGLDDPIDPYVIGSYLLTPDQYNKLKEEVPLSKKQDRRIQNAFTSNALNSPQLFSSDTPDSASPLSRLGFSPEQEEFLKKYREAWDESQRRQQQEFMDQIKQNAGAQVTVTSYLQRMDEKLDKVLEKIGECVEETKKTSLRLDGLEEKVNRLEIANNSTKSHVNGDSVDMR